MGKHHFFLGAILSFLLLSSCVGATPNSAKVSSPISEGGTTSRRDFNLFWNLLEARILFP
jgi:hypothetical protein